MRTVKVVADVAMSNIKMEAPVRIAGASSLPFGEKEGPVHSQPRPRFQYFDSTDQIVPFNHPVLTPRWLNRGLTPLRVRELIG